MCAEEEEIQRRLFELQDREYRGFLCKLIPTLNPEMVIGVPMPALRKLSRELVHTPLSDKFLQKLPHRYLEENSLHACWIGALGDYQRSLDALEAFLPYVDNWATCDQLSPGIMRRHLPAFYEHIKLWLNSDREYTVRFAIGMLMSFYLDDAFLPEMPALVAAIRSEEYYIRMIIAWYFATGLAKKRAAFMPYLENRCLDKWTHNKTIQKSIESRRIDEETKAYLRTLKVK